MVQYKHIIKSIDDYINQSSKLYEAIHPTMMTIFPKEQLQSDYGIPSNMTYTDKEYEEDLGWYEDIIINYHKTQKTKKYEKTPMILIRTDGVKAHTYPTDDKTYYPNGETITDSAKNYGIQNEILLQTNKCKEGYDVVLPTWTDIKYQARYDVQLSVKIGEDSMTLTKLDKPIECDDPILKRLVHNRDKESYNEIKNMQRENGLEQIITEVKEGKVNYEEAYNDLFKLYVTETNNKYALKYTEYLNNDFRDNNIPIRTYYTQLW